MILVDTSVLVDVIRGIPNEPALKLREAAQRGLDLAITPFTLQEVLQGAKTEAEFETLRMYLESQRLLLPAHPRDSFTAAARLYFLCRRRGLTVRSTLDCLIAQIAIEHDTPLLHNDRDFEAIAQVGELRFF